MKTCASVFFVTFAMKADREFPESPFGRANDEQAFIRLGLQPIPAAFAFIRDSRG